MKRFFLIFALLSTLSSGCKQASLSSPANKTVASIYNQTITIKNKILNVQIVSTSAEMEQGLSGRSILGSDEGMLFDFSELQDKRPGFWMKDMKFNLDFIWIKKNNPSTLSTQGRPEGTRGAASSGYSIIGITPNAPAPIGNLELGIGNLPLYYPPSDMDMALEVNAGWCKKNNIVVGDEIKVNDKN